MMAELCLHVIDLVENSVRARAKNINITLRRSQKADSLEMEIGDDGCGMDETTVMQVQDPFYTTKSGKKVGLGIPLLKAAAEMTGGSFVLISTAGQGTVVRSFFILSHIDTPPVGALCDTMLALLVAHAEINLKFKISTDNNEFTLSTEEIRQQVGDMHLSHPDILAFLRPYITENLSPMGFS